MSISPAEQTMLRGGRSVLSQILAEINEVGIKQKVEIGEVIVQQVFPCIEKENRYTIYDNNTKKPIIFYDNDIQLSGSYVNI